MRYLYTQCEPRRSQLSHLSICTTFLHLEWCSNHRFTPNLTKNYHFEVICTTSVAMVTNMRHQHFVSKDIRVPSPTSQGFSLLSLLLLCAAYLLLKGLVLYNLPPGCHGNGPLVTILCHGDVSCRPPHMPKLQNPLTSGILMGTTPVKLVQNPFTCAYLVANEVFVTSVYYLSYHGNEIQNLSAVCLGVVVHI